MTGSMRASPGGQAADRGDELVGRGVLEQETAGPGPEGLVDVLVGVEGGEDQYPGAGAVRDDLPGGPQAVQDGHPDVQQGHGREVPAYQLDGLGAVVRLGDHGDSRLGFEYHPQAPSDHLLIIGDHDGDGPLASALSGPFGRAVGGRRGGLGHRRLPGLAGSGPT